MRLFEDGRGMTGKGRQLRNDFDALCTEFLKHHHGTVDRSDLHVLMVETIGLGMTKFNLLEDIRIIEGAEKNEKSS